MGERILVLERGLVCEFSLSFSLFLSLPLSLCVLFGLFELVLNVTDRIDFYFYVLVRGLKKIE